MAKNGNSSDITSHDSAPTPAKRGTDAKHYGNIVTPVDVGITMPAIPSHDGLGRGTRDGVPGHPTRLSYSLDEVRKSGGSGGSK